MATGPTSAMLAGADTEDGVVWCIAATVDLKEPCIYIDFSLKSEGNVGVLKAVPVAEGIMFPDGSVWSRFNASESATAHFAGAYQEAKHAPGYGWRTIAASGPMEAIVAGLDEAGGTPWMTKAVAHLNCTEGDATCATIGIRTPAKLANGQIDEVKACLVENGLQFPGGSVWQHLYFEPEATVPKLWFEGSFVDYHHPDGWRTIMATGPTSAILAGADTKGGEVFAMEGVVDTKEPSISFDFSAKSKGAVAVLKATPHADGIMFYDGSVWQRYDATGSAAAVFAGSYKDMHHPEGWRTVAPTCSFETIVAGADSAGGKPWATIGHISPGLIGIDFSEKSDGAVGVLTAAMIKTHAIQFPDGNLWEKTQHHEPPRWFEGVFTDPNHPKGWRSVIATGQTSAILVGADEKGGDIFWIPGFVCPKNGGSVAFNFTKKSKGAVGVLKVVPDKKGLVFPDGSVWTRTIATGAAARFAGAYLDMHHPEGWRTIAALGPHKVMVAGLDEYGGDAWALEAPVRQSKLHIDFTAKSAGAVGVLSCTPLAKVGIKFPDGGVWEKYAPPPKPTKWGVVKLSGAVTKGVGKGFGAVVMSAMKAPKGLLIDVPKGLLWKTVGRLLSRQP